MGDWREKFRQLIKEAARDCIDRPIKVEPRRISGPRESPSDWYERDQQAKLMPQCNCCHERPLPTEMPLIRGLCGVCRARIDESPEAA